MLDDNQLSMLGVDPAEYDALSDEEKLAVEQAIAEISTGKESTIYEDLYYKDYDEIPVSFLQFICDDNYLGKSTRHGEFLYPFWKKECNDIFTSYDDCVEIALSGSIGTGKTTNACLMMAYHLYRTMCMKDPQAFFHLSPGSVITYAFLNNTLASSYGVGYNTVQQFLKESPWFLKHGSIVGRVDPEYKPEKGFDFMVGSRVQHTLGRHVICALLDEVSFSQGQDVNYEKCLVGDTVIKTTDGDYKIEDLVDKKFKVYNYSPESNSIVVSEECTAIKTMDTTEVYEIELEDGSFIKCTPFHRLMLKDGTYKMAKDLTEDDELMDIN